MMPSIYRDLTYLQSKTPSGCLKPQLVPNPVHTSPPTQHTESWLNPNYLPQAYALNLTGGTVSWGCGPFGRWNLSDAKVSSKRQAFERYGPAIDSSLPGLLECQQLLPHTPAIMNPMASLPRCTEVSETMSRSKSSSFNLYVRWSLIVTQM